MIVVGVGASAGGLESLEQMFNAMPDVCGMAFVIVQHLSPDFKSLMDQLLARYTALAIHRVEDGMLVAANSVYLIPPNQDMIVVEGRLLLTERDNTQSLSLPIDHFFRSLANDAGSRAVAVILSGTGSDGSRGIQAIHDAGGLVVVQSPDSAKFDGMPGSAIQTQLVDAIVEPGQIPDVLAEYSEHRDRETFRRESVLVVKSGIEQVFQLLQRRHHIDFSHYKPTTIGRRVKRRIDMDESIDDMIQYANRLENDSRELDQLYRDLLIGVTGFFRDAGAFDTLRAEILSMLSAEKNQAEFRAWVAACATGEEAYTVAILVDECLRELGLEADVKIFATDLHKESIRHANTGLYPVASLKEMTTERRERYFTKTDDGFQISPEIRQMVVFAPQNLIKDPPFTRLSLITCRNFLIYLMPTMQQKVLSLFHFGLRTGGTLMLGSSESPGDLADEFETIHERNRIFRKHRDIRTSPALHSGLAPRAPLSKVFRSSQEFVRMPTGVERMSTFEELLGHFMPPAIVIDEYRNVQHVFGGAGKYLLVGDGQLSSNLLEMVDEGLKLALAGAIQRCIKSGEPVGYESLEVRSGEQKELVKLVITPMQPGLKSSKYVISFEKLSEAGQRAGLAIDPSQKLELDEISRNRLGNLEQELRHTKENLQASIEEMETSNEELQATNEELIASNEELQSTNEELHSVNEELFTVNSEYQRKITELTELTNDFENLLTSTEVHTLFLDENLCIRKFTPKIAEVFHLVPHDVGRRIDAFVNSIDCKGLSEKAESVLKTGELWEEHVEDNQGHQFLMRVLPYRASDQIYGVVVTLVDISSLVAAQTAVDVERERFERAVLANRDGTWDWPDLTEQKMWWSATSYQLLGYEPDEFQPSHAEWMELIHPEDRAKILATTLPGQDRCFVELHQNFEYRMKHKSGDYRWYCHRAIVDHDENGKAVRMTGSVADIQERKKAELMATEGIRLRDNFLSMLSHELRNPMGAVLNAVTSFEFESQDAKTDLPDELKIIRRQSRHMARLLDDLLDVARFGRGRIEFRKEVVDLCELARAVIEATNFEVHAKNQLLSSSIAEGPISVLGDPARLIQAQTNLIINATKFSDPGAEIKFSIGTVGNNAVITISDHGIGIPSEMVDSIFELFVQSEDSLDRTVGGMGVGLSLARSIVEAHQGRITVTSEGTGKGSTFQILMPLTQMSLVRNGESFDEHLPGSNDGVQDTKILLVEDNLDALNMLAKSLRRRGFEVETAEDGKQAVSKFEKFQPDIAVMDIGLPEMNGYEVANTIRSNPKWNNTTLIALTGFGQKVEQEMVTKSGFDHHLVKPLKFEELKRLIENQAKRSVRANPNG